LKTTCALPQTCFLGTSTFKMAACVVNQGSGKMAFSNGLGLGNGQIDVTKYDAVGKIVTGNFKFNAENTYNDPLVGSVENFQQGVFCKVLISY
jgi:hypothetical protein